MQHLDEGLLMALLDGELYGAPNSRTPRPICGPAPECATRSAELKGFMAEADGLVADLGEPPAHAIDTSSLDPSRPATAPARTPEPWPGRQALWPPSGWASPVHTVV